MGLRRASLLSLRYEFRVDACVPWIDYVQTSFINEWLSDLRRYASYRRAHKLHVNV